MDGKARRAAGRRAYTAESKRQQLDRILKGEITAAALSRELGISRSLIQHWTQLLAQGEETAVAAGEDVVETSELRVAQQRIRELERALGRSTMELEMLRAARDEVKKQPSWYGVSTR